MNRFILLTLILITSCSHKTDTTSTSNTNKVFSCPQNHHDTPTLIAFGESLVAASDGYPTQLADAIALPIQNFGVGGSMFFYDNQYYTEMCVEINQNDVVTIQPGINDAFFARLNQDYLDKYKKGLGEVLDRLHLTGAIILLGTTEHVLGIDEPGINDIIDVYAQVTRDVYNEKHYDNVYLVDTNTLFTPTVNNMLNDHHPNTTGYNEIMQGYLNVYQGI